MCPLSVNFCPYEADSINIGGKEYQLNNKKCACCGAEFANKDGFKLWPCSIALARRVYELKLKHYNVIEVGCGLGLPGQVAAEKATVTFCEADPFISVLLESNLRENGINGTIVGNWADVNDRFDCILGSELIYLNYKPETLAAFIDRCWTRKGPCLIMNSQYYMENLFAEAIERKFKVNKQSIEDVLPDGREFTCNLWTIT